MSYRLVCLISASLALPALFQANPTFAAARDGRERAARKACMTGDPAKGVALLADLFIDTKNPTYIFNQGRCLEQNRKFEEAIARFEEFLRTADQGLSREDREAAEKHIASCKETLAQERGIAPPTVVAQPLPPPAPPPVPPPVPPTTTETSPALVTKPKAKSESHGTRSGAGLRTAGIVTASVGVAAVVAGIILNVKANSMINDMETTNNGYSVGKVDEQKGYETAAWVSYGVGAACVATGALLFGISFRRGKGSSTHVALLPAVGPGQAGALLTGGF